MMISVNILCWNNKDTLNETLKVLDYELCGRKHEIIVVDNGSDDGTAEFLARCTKKNPKIKAVINPANRGISKGKNQGIDKSSGDLIVLLDGDIIPIPGSIICLIDYMKSNQAVDAIGFLPNKWTNQKNQMGDHGQKHHEEVCKELFDPHIHDSHCIYYGIYRRHVFNVCRFCEEGEFGHPGYGWEDFDFYRQMEKAGIKQWAAGMNNAAGKYYHEINSSIRNMGTKEFRDTSLARQKLYKQRWPECSID